LSFSHVENEYLQAAVDWGIPGAVLIGVAVIWVLITAFRRWRDGPLVAGALGSIAVIGLQSIVDFGIEMPGIAVPMTAIVATVTYVPLSEVAGRQLAMARATSLLLVAALVASVALLFSSATTSIEEDHAAVAARRSRLRVTDLHEILERHPLDSYGYALIARIMVSDNDPHAVRFLNHALRLHPTHAGLHHLAARMLYRVARFEQATIEYSLAVRATTAIQPLITEIVQRFDVTLAAAAIPVESNLQEVSRILFELKRTDVATLWLQRVLEASPGNLDACETLYKVSFSTHDLTAAETATRLCGSAAPSYEDRIGLGKMLLISKRPAEVVKLLEDVESWTGRIDNKVAGWLLVCDAHAAQDHWDETKRCLHRLDATGYVSNGQRAEITTRLDRVEQSLRRGPQR